ncbi:MAG TPA: WbqC family protein [Alcaligenes faecalis]|nr:WbqC family protein [Alcaligenes faecalis]
MKTVIMQPYFFPYIGYYQLARKADKFIFLDNVNYIKKGYINRNSITSNNEKTTFTIPINKASQFKKINELFYIDDFSKFLKQIFFSYKKHEYFHEIYEIIEKICLDNDNNVANKNALSIREIFNYLEIPFNSDFSSNIPINKELTGENRIIELCRQLNTATYINAEGGKTLYHEENFKKNEINLEFHNSQIRPYEQKTKVFIPYLSIIDVLMNNGKKTKNLI